MHTSVRRRRTFRSTAIRAKARAGPVAVALLLSMAPVVPVVAAGVGQYGPPEWLPVRSTALVGCVVDNCSGPYHGYWAIDLLDPERSPGDPIYSAGAGQAFITQTGSGCGGPGTPGNTVRVDHGGGVRTIYGHFQSISISNGQWVDHNTILGVMGSTGYTDPCPTYHLHFEKQVNGVRVDPGPLKACHGSNLVAYPAAAGYSDWNAIPFKSRSVQSDGTSCAQQGSLLDFNGDGISDLGIYRAPEGRWYLKAGPTGDTFIVHGAQHGGQPGDIPLVGDFNGDGISDLGIYRAPEGRWYLKAGPTGDTFIVHGAQHGGYAGDLALSPSRFDFKAPNVTGDPDSSANHAGWYRTPVAIRWAVDDPEPSVGPPAGVSPTTAATEDQGVTYTAPSLAIRSAIVQPANFASR